MFRLKLPWCTFKEKIFGLMTQVTIILTLNLQLRSYQSCFYDLKGLDFTVRESNKVEVAHRGTLKCADSINCSTILAISYRQFFSEAPLHP